MNDDLADTDAPTPEPHDPYAALRIRDFRLYLCGNCLAMAGMQMQTVAVGWEICERIPPTMHGHQEAAWALGLVGLIQALPVILLALPAGHVSDLVNRRYVLMASLAALAVASLGLAYVTSTHADTAWIYACLFVVGVARAFQQPAKSSLLPQLVPRDRFPNAVTWGTSGFQLASVIGPALGGALIALFHSPAIVFLCDSATALTFCGLLTQVKYHRPPEQREPISLASLGAGAVFVARHRVILGAILLDMFAVLLGGAVALLPIYAKDILQVGPVEPHGASAVSMFSGSDASRRAAATLGLLYAAPAVGALCMSFVMSHRPPLKRAGRALLTAVATFGVATIVFGVSRWLPLSLAMLFVTGMADNISVVVRHSLVQLNTPEMMRGRVSAINGMFISVSNEIGGFESGTVASWFSAPISVVSGGIGTLLVVAIAAWRVPELRRYGRLSGNLAESPLAADGELSESEVISPRSPGG